MCIVVVDLVVAFGDAAVGAVAVLDGIDAGVVPVLRVFIWKGIQENRINQATK